jgi:hypothetical protein
MGQKFGNAAVFGAGATFGGDGKFIFRWFLGSGVRMLGALKLALGRCWYRVLMDDV